MNLNTKQLIVLWYTALALVAGFLFKAFDKSSIWYYSAAIVLLSTLIIYTLRPNPQVRGGWLALGVLGPILLCITAVLVVRAYNANRVESTKPLPYELSSIPCKFTFSHIFTVLTAQKRVLQHLPADQLNTLLRRTMHLNEGFSTLPAEYQTHYVNKARIEIFDSLSR